MIEMIFCPDVDWYKSKTSQLKKATVKLKYFKIKKACSIMSSISMFIGDLSGNYKVHDTYKKIENAILKQITNE